VSGSQPSVVMNVFRCPTFHFLLKNAVNRLTAANKPTENGLKKGHFTLFQKKRSNYF
jgi:hypothetical protein